MKGFFKTLGVIVALAAVAGAAIAIYDRVVNKNAIKGEYLDCGEEEEEFEINNP